MQLSNSFVVIEGVSFAGKTGTLKVLNKLLCEKYGDTNIVLTQEPWKETSTIENRLFGNKLLNYVTKDRSEHLKQIIIPAINKKQIVVSSRYLVSTLVYQVLDPKQPCDFDTCWALNSGFLVPGLTVFLYASEDVIEKRAKERTEKSRFEIQADFRKNERIQYMKVITFLRSKGWNILSIDTSKISVYRVADKIMNAIENEV
jgi:thymidylate kinase